MPAVPGTVLDVVLEAHVGQGKRVLAQLPERGAGPVPAAVAWLGGAFHQLRCAVPLGAVRGDAVLLTDPYDDAELAAGVVLDPFARRHGPTNDDLVRLAALARGEDPSPVAHGAADAVVADLDAARAGRGAPLAPLSAAALALEARVRAAGPGPLVLADEDVAAGPRADSEDDAPARTDGDAAGPLAELVARGRLVAVGDGAWVHADALDEAADALAELSAPDATSLADALGIGVAAATALLAALG